jgi:hypothetical protein
MERVGLWAKMKKNSLELIIKALNDHQVKYLIAGGLAVVAHGYLRFTADIDLMLGMDEANLKEAVEAFSKLKYQPRAPVEIALFIDPAHRRDWIVEKGLTVFSLFSREHPATEIDLFINPPLNFADAYSRASWLEVAPGLKASFCSLDDLIELKQHAGRPLDINDIEQLRKLKGGGR